ncbi:MAG: hypothetical protein AAF710_11955 [Planctomycetota bacterium]
MPDVDAAVGTWKQQLLETESIGLRQADELEDHLRQEIAQLETQGLRGVEAFTVARLRVGDGEALAERYYATNPARVWCRRLLWMVLGFLGIHCWDILVLRTTGAFGSNLMAAMGAARWVYLVCGMAMWLLLIGGSLWAIYRIATRGHFPGLGRWSARRAWVALLAFMTVFTMLGVVAAAVDVQSRQLWFDGFYDELSSEVDLPSWSYWLWAWMPYSQYWMPIMLLALVGVLAWRGSQGRDAVPEH